MKYASKADRNQPEIVAALRGMGAVVQHLHMVGKGCPDLMVGWKGNTVLLEVKDGEAKPSARKLTPDEIEWHRSWVGGPLYVVSSSAEAVGVVYALSMSTT